MTRLVRLIGLSLVAVLVIIGASSQITYGDPGTIDITVSPAVISSWGLAVGDYPDNEQTATLTVTSTDNWTVTATDENTAQTNGRMTSYYSANSTYVTGTKLDNAMKVGCAAQGREVTLPSGGIVATGSGNASPTIFFRQKIEYKDWWLDATTGNYYRIVITFTGTTT